MKTIIINTSPRKNGNTARLLKKSMEGACSAGSQVEYIDLYDLNFTGCRSCLACKIKDGRRCKCFWNDELSPVIDRILRADNLIIGTPVYFGQPSAHFRALLERLLFCVMSYDGDGSYFKGKVNTGIIYTMNAPSQYYENGFKTLFKNHENLFGLLNGTVTSYASCDTVQVSDYSKYSMGVFSEEKKKAHYDVQFPADLQAAFEIGKNMNI